MQYIGAALYTVILAAGVVCMLGLWQMKKWGVIAFVVLFVLGQLVAITQGGWSLGGFVAWLIALIVGIMYYPKMR